MIYSTIPSQDVINKTKASLEANGFKVLVVENSAEAKEKVSSLIPQKSEVMTMSSVTLDTTGIANEVNESGKYDSVKSKLASMNKETQANQMRQLGAAPEYAIGSVHAVTQDGKVVVVSNTGSQLPAYAFGAKNVVWIVGAQKIVENLDQAMDRINTYVLPLESERANAAYHMTAGSFVSKVLIFNREYNPQRVTIILVKEVLGY